jgi:hypothetical protein
MSVGPCPSPWDKLLVQHEWDRVGGEWYLWTSLVLSSYKMPGFCELWAGWRKGVAGGALRAVGAYLPHVLPLSQT